MATDSAPHRPLNAARRCVLWAVAISLALAACSGDDPLPLPEPVAVETCDELIDVSVQLVEVWVDVLEDIPVDQLLADSPPPEFEELGEIGRDLDQRASRLDCNADQINTEVRSRLADSDIDAEGPVAQMVLDLVNEGVVGELPTPPTTTPPPATSG